MYYMQFYPQSLERINFIRDYYNAVLSSLCSGLA